MSDAARRPWDPAPRINHWVYEAVPGQIRGYDEHGRPMLSIDTDPDFASRLVAAFSAVLAAPRGAEPAHPAYALAGGTRQA